MAELKNAHFEVRGDAEEDEWGKRTSVDSQIYPLHFGWKGQSGHDFFSEVHPTLPNPDQEVKFNPPKTKPKKFSELWNGDGRKAWSGVGVFSLRAQ